MMLSRRATHAHGSCGQMGARTYIFRGSRSDRSFRRDQSSTSHNHIHVLGLGRIGTFAAHSLAEAPKRPEITLLLHKARLLDDFVKNDNRISLQTKQGEIVNHGYYDYEILSQSRSTEPLGQYTRCRRDPYGFDAGPEPALIENLIVAVKVSQTVAALTPLRHRLGCRSTIVFLQNGSGVIEEVNEKLFYAPEARPNYVIGVISHGVASDAPFRIRHTGYATTSLGLVPRQDSSQHASLPSSMRFVDTLCSAPRLEAKSYSFVDVLQIQLEKLALNAFTNPLSALHDTETRFLRTMPEVRRQLMSEISAVIQKLPELQHDARCKERFSAENLDVTVNGIVERNLDSTPSMVWDLRAGRTTEIRFINGYWSRRGQEVGVKTPMNDDLVRRVEERASQHIRY